MKSRVPRFNTYLAIGLLLCAGCHTESSRISKEEFSTLRVFLEGNSAEIAGQGTVQITRQKIPVTIEREPILTEGDLSRASVVDYPDGTFAIQVTFNDHGTLVLDMTTTAYRGKRLIVFSQFPKPGKVKKLGSAASDSMDSDTTAPILGNDSSENPDRTAAWLGAVIIRARNATGSIRITPDASRAEAARIVRGLNNLVAEVAKKNKHSS